MSAVAPSVSGVATSGKGTSATPSLAGKHPQANTQTVRWSTVLARRLVRHRHGTVFIIVNNRRLNCDLGLVSNITRNGANTNPLGRKLIILTITGQSSLTNVSARLKRNALRHANFISAKHHMLGMPINHGRTQGHLNGKHVRLLMVHLRMNQVAHHRRLIRKVDIRSLVRTLSLTGLGVTHVTLVLSSVLLQAIQRYSRTVMQILSIRVTARQGRESRIVILRVVGRAIRFIDQRNLIGGSLVNLDISRIHTVGNG